ncbi:MAG: carotenoid biosynthesis protein [Chitinophagaceae bacterium]|nr:carotenoid biosynthesis protein [Chitinophagaceae bacterium]
MNKIIISKTATVYIAIIIHGFGIIGILSSQYSAWFIKCTPFNLIIMAILLLLQQEKTNKKFWLFAGICFSTGFIAELVGTHTGLLFGEYSYGERLGPKLWQVPLLIGLNWFVIVYCVGSFMEKLHHRMASASSAVISPVLVAISVIIDGAAIATLFDYFMEPVAISLGYWQWKTPDIPFYNYLCWFVLSALLLWLMRKLQISTKNHFATHLLIIQGLFFLILNLFL